MTDEKKAADLNPPKIPTPKAPPPSSPQAQKLVDTVTATTPAPAPKPFVAPPAPKKESSVQERIAAIEKRWGKKFEEVLVDIHDHIYGKTS